MPTRRQRTCMKKVRYTSRDTAGVGLLKLLTTGKPIAPRRLVVYECPVEAGHYHVGHVKRRRGVKD